MASTDEGSVRRRNLRTALLLAALAMTFFVGFFISMSLRH